MIRGGLPAPEVQYRIEDEYGFVLARADLAYPEALLAIEYDGSTHFSTYVGKRDRHRHAVLAGYGWLTLRCVDHDLDALPQTLQRIGHLLRTRAAAVNRQDPAAS